MFEQTFNVHSNDSYEYVFIHAYRFRANTDSSGVCEIQKIEEKQTTQSIVCEKNELHTYKLQFS